MNEEILYARYLVQGANDSLVKRTFVLFYENRDPRVTRKGENVYSVSSNPRWRHFDDITRANFRESSNRLSFPRLFLRFSALRTRSGCRTSAA